jgi:hypothetical protein
VEMKSRARLVFMGLGQCMRVEASFPTCFPQELF